MTNKETDCIYDKKKLSSLDIIDEVEVIFDKIKLEFSDKSSENNDLSYNEKIESGLNPDSDIMTTKDPDEIIILSNEEMKKMNNHKNKNQPF